jgi:hypothetical protein
VSGRPQLKFRLGKLDLVLTQEFTAEDVGKMLALKAEGPDADFWKKFNQLLEMLLKCALPSSPTLTLEELKRNFLATDDLDRVVAALAELYRTAEVA